jgi:hypothetical protein
MACVRFAVVLLLAAGLSVPLACSTKSPSPAATGDDASMTVVDEGGSPADCTNAGGTCVTFQTACPILQQNTVLCGDSVMICCLPPDDAAPFMPPVEGGAPPDSGPAPEAGPVEASSDASTD